MLKQLERFSPTTRRVLRAALGVAGGVGFGLATLALLFVGMVELTGCFISCDNPNPLGGSLLLAGSSLATGLLFVSLGWGAGMNGRPHLFKVFGVGVGLALVLVITVVAFVDM